MKLYFDPGNFNLFKAEIRGIHGYPVAEDLPIKEMIFESGAVWRLPELLSRTGLPSTATLFIVMDRTPMQREGKNLKELILQILQNAGWSIEVIFLEPDGTG